jgi:putative FmdB family regulatory protein
MPTYDYECTACSHTFEKLQQITSKPLRRCPVCNGRVRRLIGAGSGIIFKGSGFYETDYKRKKSSAPPEPKCDSCPAKADKTCDGKPAETSAGDKETPRPNDQGNPKHQ